MSDLVVLNRVSNGELEESLVVNRAAARSIAGALLEPTDLFPMRHRVRGFPSEHQWRELQVVAH